MKDCNCIFCKIANGEIPSTTLYEDEDFRVILDMGPATRGHALLLPKEHYANLFELDDAVAGKALVTAKKVAARMKEALGADGFNLVQNNGEAAGQTVMHFHIHLIPRYENDQAGILWTPGSTTPEEMKEIRRLVQN
ncbi:MAG: HIT family protein [Lachnospiraceae bacterium]|nr:HIT family protein [Lachnospiraceae bacterium]